jgi:hypothetical protein
MYAPAPSDSQHPRRRIVRRRRRRPSALRRLAKHTQTMELSARIGINGLLIAVSVSTLGQLVPYIYSRAEQLQVLEEAVANAEASTTQLKADFGRYFDPWQTENLMQEQSGYKSSTERQIVWTEPKWD